MKTKAFRKVSAALMAIMLVFGAFSMTAFAEELPIDIPTPDKATVSEETDKATNEDPDMGTKFYKPEHSEKTCAGSFKTFEKRACKKIQKSKK